MFTIIGGDNREYGPVTTEQVRAWLTAGRANLDTKARAVGSDEWRRLGDFPEFAPPAEPPPLLGTVPAAPGVSATTPDANLASLGARFLGALVDGVLKGLCWMPAGSVMWERFREEITAGRQPTPMDMMAAMNEALMKAVPFLLALAVVQGVLLTLRGQSIGKIAARTRIVRYTDGGKAGFVRAFLVRGGVTYFLEQIPILGGLFWIVNVCFIFGEERRCVHDFIAGTKVVRA
jgi:uncharacterized RDD family membrane protein YckC